MSLLMTGLKKKKLPIKKTRRPTGAGGARGARRFARGGGLGGAEGTRVKTTTWYWNLDGIPTTVIYYQDSQEVWCNGYILETVVNNEGYEEELDVGGYIAFSIYLDEADSAHDACIRRHLEESGVFSNQLYVDDCPIPEYEHHPTTTASTPQRPTMPELDDEVVLRALRGEGQLPDYYNGQGQLPDYYYDDDDGERGQARRQPAVDCLCRYDAVDPVESILEPIRRVGLSETKRN